MSRADVHVLTAKPVEYAPRQDTPKVDHTDPVGIQRRLAQLADELHELGPWHAYVAGRVMELERQMKRTELRLWPKANPPMKDPKLKDREAFLQSTLERDYAPLLDNLLAAQAHREVCRKRLEYLDAERSILQSLLKRHTEEDRNHGHGQAAGQEPARRAA